MSDQDEFSIDEHTYEEIEPFLHKRDGYHHVIVLHSYSKLSTKFFECEKKFTLQLDNFIVQMQKQGYDLYDVKVSPLNNPNILGAVSGYSIMIIYA